LGIGTRWCAVATWFDFEREKILDLNAAGLREFVLAGLDERSDDLVYLGVGYSGRPGDVGGAFCSCERWHGLPLLKGWGGIGGGVLKPVPFLAALDLALNHLLAAGLQVSGHL
jgi:hypothetical protein